MLSRKDIYRQDIEKRLKNDPTKVSAAELAIDSLRSYGVDEAYVELLQDEFTGALDIEGIEESMDAMESLIERASLVLDGYTEHGRYRHYSSLEE